MLEHVEIAAADPHRFASVLSAGEYEALLDLIGHSGHELRGRVIWNVNSTAKGGGVVELLRPLLGYARGIGIDARWLVIAGGADFFEVTKRIHNHLHGDDGDGGTLGEAEHAVYERTLAANATELIRLVGPRDVVILHDPQTAGLVETVRERVAGVIWRCHVGLDRPNEIARRAWKFLTDYVTPADAYVFSRAGFAWDSLERERVTVIRPSIDAFSPKNAELTREHALAILDRAGIAPHRAVAEATFVRANGSQARIERRAELLEGAPLTVDDRVVTQVSRWDRLKDPIGVMTAFVDHIAVHTDAHMLLVGPETASVADDPEGAAVFASVRERWLGLPVDLRRRVHLASLPMDDPEENAVIVNALQRHSEIVVQKSLAEGFGLTVAEAMWKSRPVVASRVGGIRDQISDGRSGILVSDPRDLGEFGRAVTSLLAAPERARDLGQAAHRSVREHFLGPHHLGRYFEVIRRVLWRTEGVHDADRV